MPSPQDLRYLTVQLALRTLKRRFLTVFGSKVFEEFTSEIVEKLLSQGVSLSR
jgi:hypothetical protein